MTWGVRQADVVLDGGFRASAEAETQEVFDRILHCVVRRVRHRAVVVVAEDFLELSLGLRLGLAPPALDDSLAVRSVTDRGLGDPTMARLVPAEVCRLAAAIDALDTGAPTYLEFGRPPAAS